MTPSPYALMLRSWRHFLFCIRRGQLYRELEEELALHHAMKQQEMSPADADISRKQMGNITLAREECREMWSFMSLERILQDLRYALRTFRKTPAFTAIAVISVALGIGGNTAMFSLVNALLVRPLPYFEPEHLVRITGVYPRAAVRFFQQQGHGVDISAVSTGSESNLIAQGIATRVVASTASANLLQLLGASVAKGRGFENGEDMPGRDRVAILSDALWRTRFASDPTIIGRVIKLNGVDREVVGIMPKNFAYPSANVQLWIPMRLDPSNFLEYWAGEFVPLVARLHSGVTVAAAHNEVRRLLGEFRKTFPYPMARDWNADVTVMPLQADIVGDIRGKLIILLASVAIVLLIACTNVAGLLLSRATTRRKEIALRMALGAGRPRIIRQLLTESVALALLGAFLGIGLGIAALSTFKSLLPTSTPGLAQAGIDWPVVGAITVVALLTGLAFGLSPALSASRVDLMETIKTGSQRSIATLWTQLRSLLVLGEVALTVVLVVSAGLLLRSLYKLSDVNPGFNPTRILTVRISPDQLSCAQPSVCIALYNRVLDRARNLPGVAAAAVANSIPLQGELPLIPVDVEDHPKTADHPSPMFWFGAVSADYVDLMGIHLVSGRKLTPADSENANRVVLISASTAKHFWPHESAIGKHVKTAGEQQWRTVVGVVTDVRQYTLTTGLPGFVPGAVYMPYAQSVREDGQIPAAMTLLVKAKFDDANLAREVQRIAKDQAPNIPVSRVQALEEQAFESLSGFRSLMRVFLSFAGTALLLAAIGIYGLMSYWVSQRTYEIGLRVAIGATRQRIVSMILRQGIRISLYGIFGGIVAAFVMTRFLSGLLYGVTATDAVTFAVVVMLVLSIAGIATAVPAWRAARIDPATSLRAE